MVVIVLWAALAVATRGDGKLFALDAPVPVRIPEQSALICFDGETQRLVIENRFEGDAEEMAWVVPLPAVPKIEAATPGLFPTLRHVTRPSVEIWRHRSASVFLTFGLLMFAGCFVMIRVGLKLGLVFLWAGGLVLLGLSLSALGCSLGAESIQTQGVTVLDQGRVGVYDTTTLTGESGRSVRAWLRERGFAVSEQADRVLQDYIDEGWVFAAARVSDPERLGRGRIHPLSFAFPSVSPVYPLRLTGADQSALELDLYIVADSQMACDVLECRRSGWLFRRGALRDYATEIKALHPLLAEYTKGLDYMTVISGTLGPEAMARDLEFTPAAQRPYRPVLHTKSAAFEKAALAASAVLVAPALLASIVFLLLPAKRRGDGAGASTPGTSSAALRSVGPPWGQMLVLVLLSLVVAVAVGAVYLGVGQLTADFLRGSVRYWMLPVATILVVAAPLAGAVRWKVNRAATPRPPPSVLGTWSWPAAILVASATVGGGVYAGLDTIPKSDVRPRPATLSYFYRMRMALAMRAETEAITENVIREEIAALTVKLSAQADNPFVVVPREEDSPFNYTVESVNGTPTLFSYDGRGARIECWPCGMDVSKRHPPENQTDQRPSETAER
jgi:hypothetical protein